MNTSVKTGEAVALRDDEHDDRETTAIVKAVANPFGVATAASKVGGAVAESLAAREIAEVQGALTIAQKFPRSPMKSMDRILAAFMRPSLAEAAQYQYARGGTDIQGPSIRAAETIAQNWGNLQFGWRVLEHGEDFDMIEAMAWDLETNTRTVRQFPVEHIRYTKTETKRLKDPRDIYENNANNASRRMRACILALIPGDVTKAAMDQAQQTLLSDVKNFDKEAVAKMLVAFQDLGVSRAAIEKNIQRRIEGGLTPQLFLRLRRIYQSLRDGMSRPEDWFDMEPTIEQAGASTSGNGKTAQLAQQMAERAAASGSDQVASAAATGTPTEAAAESAPVQSASQEQAASETLFTHDEPPMPNFAKMSAEQTHDAIEQEAAGANISEQRLREIIGTFGGKATKANAPGIIAAIRAAAGGGEA